MRITLPFTALMLVIASASIVSAQERSERPRTAESTRETGASETSTNREAAKSKDDAKAAVALPDGGRAPGWDAGIVVASRLRLNHRRPEPALSVRRFPQTV